MLPPSAPHRRPPDDSGSGLDGALLSPGKLGPSLALGAGRLRVRVGLAFFILAVAPGIARGAQGMAVCAAIVFSALLAHELGHALCGILCGSRATIQLHFLGAHTLIEPPLTHSLVSTC